MLPQFLEFGGQTVGYQMLGRHLDNHRCSQGVFYVSHILLPFESRATHRRLGLKIEVKFQIL